MTLISLLIFGLNMQNQVQGEDLKGKSIPKDKINTVELSNISTITFKSNFQIKNDFYVKVALPDEIAESGARILVRLVKFALQNDNCQSNRLEILEINDQNNGGFNNDDQYYNRNQNFQFKQEYCKATDEGSVYEAQSSPILVHLESDNFINTYQIIIRFEVLKKGRENTSQLTSTEANCECGKVHGDKDESSLVTEGEDVPKYYNPWMAFLSFTLQSYNGREMETRCGGTLISKKYILTAAHCFKQNRITNMKVYLGQHDKRNFTEGSHTAYSHIIKNADHDQDDTSDIALVRLREPVVFNELISTICLPREGFKSDEINGMVAGWGHTAIDDPDDEIDSIGDNEAAFKLQEVKMKTMSLEKCHELFEETGENHKNSFSDNELCTIGEGYKDGCLGDSGGPFYVKDGGRFVQMGITSKGFGCGSFYPALFTKVSAFYNWIEANTRDSPPCFVTPKQ